MQRCCYLLPVTHLPAIAFKTGSAYASVLPLPVGAQIHMSCAALCPPARPRHTAVCTGKSSWKPSASETANLREGSKPCTCPSATPLPVGMEMGKRIHGNTGAVPTACLLSVMLDTSVDGPPVAACATRRKGSSLSCCFVCP